MRGISSGDSLAIELRDSPEHIFDRLVFSDENDRIYKDDAYKNRHRAAYLSEIRKDIAWYGRMYSDINNKFDMKGNPPETVADQLVRKYRLNKMGE